MMKVRIVEGNLMVFKVFSISVEKCSSWSVSMWWFSFKTWPSSCSNHAQRKLSIRTSVDSCCSSSVTFASWDSFRKHLVDWKVEVVERGFCDLTGLESIDNVDCWETPKWPTDSLGSNHQKNPKWDEEAMKREDFFALSYFGENSEDLISDIGLKGKNVGEIGKNQIRGAFVLCTFRFETFQ